MEVKIIKMIIAKPKEMIKNSLSASTLSDV